MPVRLEPRDRLVVVAIRPAPHRPAAEAPRRRAGRVGTAAGCGSPPAAPRRAPGNSALPPSALLLSYGPREARRGVAKRRQRSRQLAVALYKAAVVVGKPIQSRTSAHEGFVHWTMDCTLRWSTDTPSAESRWPRKPSFYRPNQHLELLNAVDSAARASGARPARKIWR